LGVSSPKICCDSKQLCCRADSNSFKTPAPLVIMAAKPTETNNLPQSEDFTSVAVVRRGLTIRFS
jgi:hypothetical protein